MKQKIIDILNTIPISLDPRVWTSLANDLLAIFNERQQRQHDEFLKLKAAYTAARGNTATVCTDIDTQTLCITVEDKLGNYVGSFNFDCKAPHPETDPSHA